MCPAARSHSSCARRDRRPGGRDRAGAERRRRGAGPGGAGRGQDHAGAGRRPGAGRAPARHEPHLHDRQPLRRRRHDRIPPRPLPDRLAAGRGSRPAGRLSRRGPDRVRRVARGRSPRARGRAPGGEDQPPRAATAGSSWRTAGSPSLDRARAGYGDRGHGGGPAAGGRHVLEAATTPPGAHPGHATRLLAMAAELLADAGIDVGAGSSGSRSGWAPAPSPACASAWPPRAGSPSRGGSSSWGSPACRRSRWRARGHRRGGRRGGERADVALAVIDARRGEVFAAAYERGPGRVPRELTPAAALAPERLVGWSRRSGSGQGELAAGRRRCRALPRAAHPRGPGAGGRGLAAASGRAPRRSASSGGAGVRPGTGGALPDYVRRPDAELALEGAGASRAAAMTEPSTARAAQPASAGDRDPAPQLPRPAPGDRDRAARVPDAVVAGDVRARAVQAVGICLARGPGRDLVGLPDLLALRHGLARDERRRRPRPPARALASALLAELYARVGDRTRATRSRCASRTTSPSTCTSARASAPRASAAATTRTTARMP